MPKSVMLDVWQEDDLWNASWRPSDDPLYPDVDGFSTKIVGMRTKAKAIEQARKCLREHVKEEAYRIKVYHQYHLTHERVSIDLDTSEIDNA
jgi:hypothetical protein